MKMLIVCGEYFNQSNGLSISTQRFVKEFVRLGEEVRVLSSDHGGISDYSVPVQIKTNTKQGIAMTSSQK